MSQIEKVSEFLLIKGGIEPETVKRQLYKNTQIESSFGFNTLAIVDGKPKTCNLKEFLESFLTFREDVVIKKTKYDLKKAEEKHMYWLDYQYQLKI